MKIEHLTLWKDFFDEESKKDYFNKLTNFVKLGYSRDELFPKSENLFKALELTDPKNIHVIIIGQDPYHNKNQANGLAFAVDDNAKIPPSLVNIFKEIEIEFGEVKSERNLLNLAKQNVLLLNTVLTVKKHVPLSCKDWGWEKFSLNLIKYILDNNQNVVVICFGSYAQQFVKNIKNDNHYFLYCVHPSPLGAHRGFFNSNVFKETNEYLSKHNKQSIEW